MSKIRPFPMFLVFLTVAATLCANPVKLHIDVGLNHFYKQRYLEAFKEFKVAVDKAPNNPEAHFNLGRVYQVQGFFKEALLEFQTAVSLDPSYLAAKRSLAELQTRLKIDVEASQRLQGQQTAEQLRSQEIAVGSSEERGQELMRQGRLAEAALAYGEAARQQPFNARLQKVLGFIGFRQGKYRQAIEHYERARTLAPTDSEVDYAMGLIRIRTQEFQTAVTELQRAVQRSPAMAKAYYALGEAYEGLGQGEDAAFQFRKCLELDPGLTEAQTKLKNLGERLAYSYFSRGSYFYQQGDYEKAEALLGVAQQFGSLTPEQNRQISEMLGASRYWLQRHQAENKVTQERRTVQQAAHITRTISVEDVTLNPNPYQGQSVHWSGDAVFEDTSQGKQRFIVNANSSVNGDENMDFCFGIVFPKNLPADPRISTYSTISVKGKIVRMEKLFNTSSQVLSRRRQPIVEASEVSFSRTNYEQSLNLRFF